MERYERKEARGKAGAGTKALLSTARVDKIRKNGGSRDLALTVTRLPQVPHLNDSGLC